MTRTGGWTKLAVPTIGLLWLAAIGIPASPAQNPPPVRMAEQVFQNVRVLKGIPADEFLDTMGMFASALLFDLAEPSSGTPPAGAGPLRRWSRHLAERSARGVPTRSDINAPAGAENQRGRAASGSTLGVDRRGATGGGDPRVERPARPAQRFPARRAAS